MFTDSFYANWAYPKAPYFPKPDRLVALDPWVDPFRHCGRASQASQAEPGKTRQPTKPG